MLRFILLFAVCAISHGETLSDAKANTNDYCWAIHGDTWCWLTNDGKTDFAILEKGKMVGYSCDWFNGKDSGRYCEHKGGAEVDHEEEKSSYDVNGDGVGPWIAKWVKGKFGRVVGRGQCWDLANDALKAARAQGGFDIPNAPSAYVWSTERVWHTNAVPGDIVQLASWRQQEGYYFQMTGPVHTAVVVEPWDGEGLITYDQNPGPVKQTIYKPKYKTAGSLEVYRIKVRSRLLRRFLDVLAPVFQRVNLVSASAGLSALAFVALLIGLGVVATRRFSSSRSSAESQSCRAMLMVSEELAEESNAA
mmetsp:Transcript_40446/g.84598  ORF Transcript_40446/g.84598 Transcript_40446/m.84598 type:complete len:306 (-) Transcript_40446:117-1034(-)